MPEVNIIIKAKDEATGIMEGIGGSLKGLGTAFLGIGAIAGAALGGIGLGLAKLALDEAKMGPIEKAFGNLALSIGSTSDALIKKLRPATLGMLSSDELIIAAQRLLTSGLATTEDEVAKFAETATKLGLAVGKDATTSIEQFANMLLTGGTRALKEFGISTAEVEERVRALKEANADLTDEQAFQQAVMEVAAETIARTGDLSDTAAVRMASLGARVEDLKDGVAGALQPVLETFLSVVLEPLVAKFEEWAPKLTPIIETLGGLATEILNPAEGDWVSYLKNEVWEALDNAFGKESADKIVEFVLNFSGEADKFIEKFQEELMPQLEDWWKEIREDVLPAIADLASGLGEWAASDGVRLFFETGGTILKLLGDIAAAMDAVQNALQRWKSEHTTPEAEKEAWLQSMYVPWMPEGGRSVGVTPQQIEGLNQYPSTTNINVYGVPGVVEAIRDIEKHTVGSIGGP